MTPPNSSAVIGANPRLELDKVQRIRESQSRSTDLLELWLC